MKLFIEHFRQPKFLHVWNQLESTEGMERDQMVYLPGALEMWHAAVLG